MRRLRRVLAWPHWVLVGRRRAEDGAMAKLYMDTSALLGRLSRGE